MSYTAQQAEAALRPTFEAFLKAIDNAEFEAVASYYHPNGVVVHKDKECTYGPTAISAEVKKFIEMSGKSVTTLNSVKYEGAGDYLIVTAEVLSDTEKMGSVKTNLLQIWKKEGAKHLVYHDEFEIIA